MADKTVTVTLKAQIADYKAAMAEAGNAAKKTADSVKAVGEGSKGFDKIGESATRSGNSLRGAVGDVDKFGNKLSEADVAAGRYVSSAGRVVEANGKFAKGFSSSADEAESSAKRQSVAWDGITNSMLGVGAGLTGLAGTAVKKFADFDAAMSNVKASTHETEANMQLLREAAVKAGADTAYSAEEAAQGIDELAKAGVSTQDILDGGLNGALSLAAAGGIEVADASEIAASTLTQFGLSGKDVGHVADLLAAGAGKAQGSVGDLGYALNQSGLIASQAGISLEETTGTLSAFASAGLIGSDAGTSFKTMLQRLQNPSKEASELMGELGISMYDSQGNFVGMTNLAEQLKTSMQDLTPAQRDAAMATMFGSDAVRAANVLYQQGGEGINDWINKVNDAGYAAETAAAKQDNLKGDLEKLGGAFDTVFLQSGSGMNDFLRGLVQNVEGVVDAIGQIPAPVLEAAGVIAGIGGVALTSAGLLSKGIGAFTEFKDNISSLKGALQDGEGNLTAWGKSANFAFKAAAGATALAGVVEGFAAISRAVEEANISTSDIGNKLADTANGVKNVDDSFKNASWANGNGNTFWDGTVEGINGVADAVVHLQNQNGLDQFYDKGNAALGFSDANNQARDAIKNLDTQLSQMVASGSMEQATSSFKAWADQVKSQGGDVTKMANEAFPQLKASIQDYATSLNVSLTDQELMSAMMGEMPQKLTDAANAASQAGTGMGEAADGLNEVGAEAEQTAGKLKDVVDLLSSVGGAQQSMTAAQGSYYESVESLTAALRDNEFQLDATGTAFDQTSESGRNAQSAFNDTAAAGWDMANAMANNGASASELSGALTQTYNDLINNATQFGLTAEQADGLARATLGIPPNVDITTWMDQNAQLMAESTEKAVENIPGEDHVASSMDASAKLMAEDTKGAVDAIPDSDHVTMTASPDAQNQANDTTGAINSIPGSKNTTLTASNDAYNTAVNTKTAIDNIPTAKSVTINTYKNEYISSTALGSATQRILEKGKWSGGFAGSNVRGFAGGGRLIPGDAPSNPYEDNLWAIVTDTGEPIRVRSHEYISNEPAVRRGNNLAWLQWMNAGGAMPGRPRGFATGGTPGRIAPTPTNVSFGDTDALISAISRGAEAGIRGATVVAVVRDERTAADITRRGLKAMGK